MVKFKVGERWWLKKKFYTVAILKIFKYRIQCIDYNDLQIRSFDKKDFIKKYG